VVCTFGEIMQKEELVTPEHMSDSMRAMFMHRLEDGEGRALCV
jgi:hypothetical protein